MLFFKLFTHQNTTSPTFNDANLYSMADLARKLRLKNSQNILHILHKNGYVYIDIRGYVLPYISRFSPQFFRLVYSPKSHSPQIFFTKSGLNFFALLFKNKDFLL